MWRIPQRYLYSEKDILRKVNVQQQAVNVHRDGNAVDHEDLLPDASTERRHHGRGKPLSKHGTKSNEETDEKLYAMSAVMKLTTEHNGFLGEAQEYLDHHEREHLRTFLPQNVQDIIALHGFHGTNSGVGVSERHDSTRHASNQSTPFSDVGDSVGPGTLASVEILRRRTKG